MCMNMSPYQMANFPQGTPAAAKSKEKKDGKKKSDDPAPAKKKVNDTIDQAKKMLLPANHAHQIPENCFSLRGLAIILRALLM